ncbi:hypothetical protein BDY19DRAFT_226067 [Irpex rosettiformis]|uniref:Uncharacterized protein n=1 Tax=Irpex rosettiformis TaxID=378272 RepID=A0ACB8U0S3_9APHY|nr:hypothetical protein BDY19DRAFT_226067 [Irpex rosettiformis]
MDSTQALGTGPGLFRFFRAGTGPGLVKVCRILDDNQRISSVTYIIAYTGTGTLRFLKSVEAGTGPLRSTWTVFFGTGSGLVEVRKIYDSQAPAPVMNDTLRIGTGTLLKSSQPNFNDEDYTFGPYVNTLAALLRSPVLAPAPVSPMPTDIFGRQPKHQL